jgi:hypothetical protein
VSTSGDSGFFWFRGWNISAITGESIHRPDEDEYKTSILTYCLRASFAGEGELQLITIQ